MGRGSPPHFYVMLPAIQYEVVYDYPDALAIDLVGLQPDEWGNTAETVRVFWWEIPMPDTMRSVLIQGAERFINGDMNSSEFVQGLILAIAESPDGPSKQEDLKWLAGQLTKPDFEQDDWEC